MNTTVKELETLHVQMNEADAANLRGFLTRCPDSKFYRAPPRGRSEDKPSDRELAQQLENAKLNARGKASSFQRSLTMNDRKIAQQVANRVSNINKEAMPGQNPDLLKKKILKLVPDAEEYEGYSGRGMYGRSSSVAFTTRHNPRSPVGEKLKKMGLSCDNMGLDFIYYTQW